MKLKPNSYNAENYVFISFGGGPVQLIPTNPDALETYKYKYNGKEWQDELGLNVYDFGARNYQPDLGRFMNIDPHAENYFDWSPYNYVGGNPIIRVDPDGKDWDIVINHDNQTITIRGNFTTLSGNEKTLQKAADNWNAQSGKFSYMVGKGDDAISYAVNFEVSVNNPSTDVAENGVQVLSDDNRNFQERTETINGEEITIKPQGVSDGKNFAMKESQKGNSQKTAHEMGHNLGMNHSSGLMGKEGGKNLKKKSVKETLGHSGVGKGVKNSKTNATLQSSTTIGTAPDNFQEGKLKRNRDWKKTTFD